jgi:hypothetical protein
MSLLFETGSPFADASLIRRNTSVTAKMLEDIASQVQASQAETMRTLAIINPLAQCLFRDEGYSEYDRAEILRQIRDVGSATV